MQLTEIKPALSEMEKTKDNVLSMIDLHALQEDVKNLDQQTYDQAFWDDNQAAQKVIKELKTKKNKLERITRFTDRYEEAKMLVELLEMGEDISKEFEDNKNSFDKLAEDLEIELLLSEENDGLNAIIEIHPGAGGTESQDWAEMLYRMFTRFGERHDYAFELLDYQAGDEAGIKSVTFSLSGDYAYGYLKAENGVHRLVRISPFDSGGRRHTSFASINVIPEIDDNVEVEINEQDLKIDTYRSSGAGGQSVNTTDSAVRITHLPSKIVVTVQNERSQIKNRDKAMQILRGKLYQLEYNKKQEEINQYRSNNMANAFGSQIRSYVMHPYSMVKDHRTNIETGNVQKVLDGDLDIFINGFLKLLAKEDSHDHSS